MNTKISLINKEIPLSFVQKSFSRIFGASLLILSILFFWSTGCKKVNEEVGLVGVCPAVVSTDPANGAINVVTTKKITVTFNEALNPSTVNALTFTLFQGATRVAGEVTYSGVTAIFTPANPLLANAVYTGTVTTGIKDPAGNSLPANYVWSFNTGNIPIVVSTDPANGTSNVPLNKIITATFSTAMNPLTINTTTFTIKQGSTLIPGTVTYNGNVGTFTPTSPLATNKVYTGTITIGAKDLAGNALASDYVWSFATGDLPLVVTTDPINGATDVPVNKIITATFNKAMNASTINSTTFTINQGATSILGTISYSAGKATFTPSSPLLPNTLYTGTITTGAMDADGNSLASNYVWTFKTSVLPMVVSTDPANGDVNVSAFKIISATFNKLIDPLTINSTTFLVKQGATVIVGVVNYSGITATFTPASPLPTNLVYTCTITTGAKDLGGNAMAANYVWSFTTGNSPQVLLTDPSNGATNVSINKTITATFNKPMDPLTINATTFTIKQGATLIPGVITYNGVTATYNPINALAFNTVYTGTITTGAKDLLGNSIVSNYVWTFTTETSIPVPPTSGLGDFGAFGGNAGVTNQGVNTVINGSIGTTAASTLITGFHDGTTGDIYTETPLNVGLVTGRVHTAPPPPGSAASLAIANAGLLAANALYISISPANKPGGIDPGAGELGGLTLAPGIYKSASGTFKISNGNLTLDAQGNPNAVWIFQTAAGLTVGIAGPVGAKSVLMINGGLPKNVFWYVGSAATINAAGGGVMSGTIISTAGITFSTAGNAAQTVLNGRAISLVASVTMVNTTINVQ